MSPDTVVANLNYAVAALLVVIGLYALIAASSYVKKIMGLIITQSGVFLFLVGLGLIGSGEKRIVTPGFRAATLINPVPHALVLVGIMVSSAVVILALSLVVRRARNCGGRLEGGAVGRRQSVGAVGPGDGPPEARERSGEAVEAEARTAEPADTAESSGGPGGEKE